VLLVRSGCLRAAGSGLLLSLCACLQAPGRPRGPVPVQEPAHADACAARQGDPTEGGSRAAGFPLDWSPGEVLLQGYLGAKYLSEFSVNPSGTPPIELDEDEYEVLPVVGGGAQLKLAGRGLDFGVEGFLEFSGRSDLEAFASSGGTAVAVFDVSLLVFEAYGGPFVSLFAGDNLRLYGSAGPLLQWVGYDQDEDSSEEESADGSGGGLYARAGLEFLLPSRKLVGFGVRWSESSIDLGDEFGDLDLTGLDVFFTYSYGLEPRSAFDWD
jgi:hypothetical protein